MGLSDRIKASMVEGSWIRRMFEEGTIRKRQQATRMSLTCTWATR
jgi:hypothetical protein